MRVEKAHKHSLFVKYSHGSHEFTKVSVSNLQTTDEPENTKFELVKLKNESTVSVAKKIDLT